MIALKDTRGNKSLTLGFIVIAFLIGNAAFIYSVYKTGDAQLGEYGAFIFGSLLPFLVREYTEKTNAVQKTD